MFGLQNFGEMIDDSQTCQCFSLPTFCAIRYNCETAEFVTVMKSKIFMSTVYTYDNQTPLVINF